MTFPQIIKFVENCKAAKKIPEVFIAGIRFLVDIVPGPGEMFFVDLYSSLDGVKEDDYFGWEEFSHKHSKKLRRVPIEKLLDEKVKPERIAEPQREITRVLTEATRHIPKFDRDEGECYGCLGCNWEPKHDSTMAIQNYDEQWAAHIVALAETL